MADAIAAGKTAGTFKTKSRGVAKVAGGAAAAARTVELLGGIWSWAERRGLVSGPNPARGVEKHKGDAKERFLNPDELARLGAVLREQEATQPAAVAALRLIAFTGLRREEACGLRWREIDATAGCLRLETTKTGRSMRPIGRPALSLLEALPRGASEWVFPNRDDTGSADLKKRIAELFDTAGLADARAHDLRRSFATVAADEGYGDATIGELLGHARRGVTAVHYIRCPDAALIAAADRVAERIAAAMASEDDGDALPLKNVAEW
jgi:integrase